MSRQDKVTTEKHTRILRELVKRPENKLCADCKRNDPRWASWNLGVFLCIRCSGIHRGMGTHISKVKSIDLDSWTSDQMKSIQDWGNRRANLYWEALLKDGHIPPDHKMDSFIRSKYESRRWAIDGPPPADPSVLDGAQSVQAMDLPAVLPISSSSHISNNSFSTRRPASPIVQSTFTTCQPHAHRLLSAAVADHNPQASLTSKGLASPQLPTQSQQDLLENTLLSLDFRPPVSTNNSTAQSKKDVKQDILSLFSAPLTASPGTGFRQLHNISAQQSPWDSFGHSPPQQLTQPTSTMGSSRTVWGADLDWASSVGPGHLWGNSTQDPSAQQQAVMGTSDIWKSSITATGSDPGASAEKDDAFGDMWGSGL